MSDHPERRRFQRIPFDAPTELLQGERRWPVNLLDLSLKGLLIEAPNAWDADLERPFAAQIRLGEEAFVTMTVELRHVDDTQLGFICEHIDLDSLEHLCRLVELNLADRTELEREFHQLIDI